MKQFECATKEMSYLNVRRKGHCVIWTAVAPLKALNQILQNKIISISTFNQLRRISKMFYLSYSSNCWVANLRDLKLEKFKFK